MASKGKPVENGARARVVLMRGLAALLTFYAMAGVWLAVTMGTARDPRLHWVPLVVGGTAFAASAGVAALAVWRLEPKASTALIVCGVVGAALCSAMPLAVRGAQVDRNTWLVAVGGGLLFATFLLLASRFVRAVQNG